MRPTVLWLIALLGGCAGGSTGERDPLGAVPPDFSVDVSVWADAAASRQHHPDAYARPGRYVVLADGSLHWTAKPQRPDEGLPPCRRFLSRRDVAELWSLIQQLGMDDPRRGDAPLNVKLIEPEARQLVYLAVLTGRGDAWAFLRRADADQAPDYAMLRLIDQLSMLAWSDVETPTPAGPRRYDFGPDPYARYR